MKTKQTSTPWKALYIVLILLLIIGIAAYVLYFCKVSDSELINTLFQTIGNVLVVGVVIGFVTNVLQNFGLFKEELGKVLYGKDFMSKRIDIDDIWINASKVIFEEKFPDIQDEFLERIKEYLPCQDVAYYDNYETHIDLSWHDKEQGLIKVTDKKIFDLIPVSVKKFRYTYSSWTTVNSGDTFSYKLIDLSVNGRSLKSSKIKRQSPKTDNEICNKLKFSLKGASKYRIILHDEKIYNINYDYVIGFRSKHITHNFRVQLNHPEDIEATFVSCGTQHQFSTVNKSKTCSENRYEGVIFPKQGYIFALKLQ